MESFNKVQSAVAVAALLALTLVGCAFDEPGANPVVFGDAFNANEPQRFGSSIGTTIGTDASEKVEGFASLKVTVPDQGCAGADATHYCYAGWAIVSTAPRDLSGYNALTFWAKASTTKATIDELGLGQDNTGGSKYVAATKLDITNTWTKYVLPIPLPSRLTKEKGLIYFSAGTQASAGVGFTFWLDDVRFESLDASVLGPLRPQLPTQTVTRKVGTQLAIGNVGATYAVNGVDMKLGMLPGYLTWSSSNAAVATVSDGGVVSTLAFGTATITATLGAVSAAGSINIIVPGGGTAPGAFAVFDDDFTTGGYNPFDTSLGTIAVDKAVHKNGAASLRLDIPNDNCPGFSNGHYCYTGGAVVAGAGQDLSLYNALTFWSKASVAGGKFDIFGTANDNTGTSVYQASVAGPRLTTDWVKYVIPIPNGAKLGNERGLFWFAAANLAGVGYSVWLDDVLFEALPSSVLGPVRVTIPSSSPNVTVGATFNRPAVDGGGKNLGLKFTFAVTSNGVATDVTVSGPESYLSWSSSNPAIATVAGDGTGTAVSAGTATITAKAGDVAAAGNVNVTVR